MNSDSTRETKARRRVPDAIGTDEVMQEFTRFYQSGKPRVFYHALSLFRDRRSQKILPRTRSLRLFAES